MYLSCVCKRDFLMGKIFIIRNSNVCCSYSEGQFCFKDITVRIHAGQASDLAERVAHVAKGIFHLKTLKLTVLTAPTSDRRVCPLFESTN